MPLGSATTGLEPSIEGSVVKVVAAKVYNREVPRHKIEENHRIGLCVCPVAPTGVTGALTGLPVSSGGETGGRDLSPCRRAAARLFDIVKPQR
jgi:hypothetical protein